MDVKPDHGLNRLRDYDLYSSGVVNEEREFRKEITHLCKKRIEKTWKSENDKRNGGKMVRSSTSYYLAFSYCASPSAPLRGGHALSLTCYIALRVTQLERISFLC